MVHQSRLRRDGERDGGVDGRRHSAAPRQRTRSPRRRPTPPDRHRPTRSRSRCRRSRRSSPRAQPAPSSTTTWRSPIRRSTSVDAEISYFTAAGATVTQSLTLPAQSRRTIKVDEVPGLAATPMSASVRTTTAPIVVERTMRWDRCRTRQHGSHTEKASERHSGEVVLRGRLAGVLLHLSAAGQSARGAPTRPRCDCLLEGGPPVKCTLKPSRRLSVHDRSRRRRRAGRPRPSASSSPSPLRPSPSGRCTSARRPTSLRRPDTIRRA